MKKKLYIDFDGVILDTIGPMYEKIKNHDIELYNRNLNHTVSPEDVAEIRGIINNIDWDTFLEKTNDINNSVKHINDLIESKLFDVTILTHVNSFKEMEAKFKFICDNINGEIDIISVPTKFDKTVATRSCKDCILIDDHSGNLRKWIAAGGIGVKFTKEPRKHPEFKCISSLDQVIEIVENM